MDEWQSQEQNVSLRGKWLVNLGMALEQVEESYLMGGIDRAEYESQLQDLDAKLYILGLSLAVKPWLKPNANRL